MSLSDLSHLGDFLKQWGWGGVTAALGLLFLYGFRQAWWHLDADYQRLDKAWRERFDDLKVEKDTWKTLALSGGRLSMTAVELAEAHIKGAPTP